MLLYPFSSNSHALVRPCLVLAHRHGHTTFRALDQCITYQSRHGTNGSFDFGPMLFQQVEKGLGSGA